jgi:hypothetical protein
VRRSWVEHLCPAYAVSDIPSTHPRSYGLGKCEGALSGDEIARHILARYAGGAPRARFVAQRDFVRAVRLTPTFGYEHFAGTRTWKEQEAAQEGGAVKEVTRTEPVVVCAGFGGLALLGAAADPLAYEDHALEDILKWTTSKDRKIFAFTVDEERVYYIITDAAPDIVELLERYVEERLKMLDDGEGDGEGAGARAPPDSSARPRELTDDGVGIVPDVVSVLPPPPSAWMEGGEAALLASVGETRAAGGGTIVAGGLAPRGFGGGALALGPPKSAAAALASATKATAPLAPLGPSSSSSSSSLGSGGGGAASSAASAARGAGGVGAAAAAATANPGQRPSRPAPLPQGWLELTSDEGEVYYFHDASGTTQWERPRLPGLPVLLTAPLPPGWSAAVDAETGEPYYFHPATGESQWEKPELPEENLAPGWRALVDEDGDAYFWHVETGKTTWDKPRAAAMMLEGGIVPHRPLQSG